MIKKSMVVSLIFSCSILGGCSSFNSAADYLGVNFWTKKAKKAPCKLVSISSSDIPCYGEKIPKPGDEVIHTLRGLYVFT